MHYKTIWMKTHESNLNSSIENDFLKFYEFQPSKKYINAYSRL
jgi:hypothetical protein